MHETDADGFTFIRDDIWREGRYIDLWSLVHTLSGVIGGLIAYYTPFAFWSAFSIATVVFILWEIFERLAIVEEYFTNQITDVLFGQLGFVLAFPASLYITDTTHHYTTIAIFVVALILAAFGWTANSRAEQLKKRLKAEWLAERAQLHEVHAHLKEEWKEYKKAHFKGRKG